MIPTGKQRQRRGRFQFGLAALMLVVMLAGVLAAVLSGILRADEEGIGGPVFVLLAVAAPMGLMIAMSLLAAAHRYWSTWRHRRKPAEDEENTENGGGGGGC
jgi:cytochrome b